MHAMQHKLDHRHERVGHRVQAGDTVAATQQAAEAAVREEVGPLDKVGRHNDEVDVGAGRRGTQSMRAEREERAAS
eukprot:2321468-Prymnesium_polylepis.1